MDMKHAASIGIIGGADGPTAVFVASKTSLWEWILGLAVAAGLIWFGIHLIMKNKKRK